MSNQGLPIESAEPVHGEKPSVPEGRRSRNVLLMLSLAAGVLLLIMLLAVNYFYLTE